MVAAPGMEGGALDAYLADLDARIADLDREWIERAAEAVKSFATPGRRRFYRNDASKAAGDQSGTTSTARAFLALHEYCRYLQIERPKGAGEPDEEIAAVLRGTLRHTVLSWSTSKGRKDADASSENQRNFFSDAHMLIAVSLAPLLPAELSSTRANAEERLRQTRGILARRIRPELERRGVIALTRGDAAAHPFITLHCLRALDAAGLTLGDAEKVRAEISATVLEQLAYDAAGVMARFDPGSLVSAAALLGRLKASDREQLTLRAVEVAARVQTEDGAWHSSQIVAAKGRSRIYVSSYEVALGLTFLALRELAYGNLELAMMIVPILGRAMDLVRATYVSGEARTDGLAGWANDRSRWPGLVESWASASVLSFLVRYREVLVQLRQQLVLGRYGGAVAIGGAEVMWPDLSLAFPAEREPRSQKTAIARVEGELGAFSDPSEDRSLTGSLAREIVLPILRSPGERPERSSLILYGQPGTRKTSLSRALARALDWPLLTVSPPDFLGEGGLDGFERSAARIFEDLLRLRRVVVLFDECEDFFRPRPRSPAVDMVEGDEEGDSPKRPDPAPAERLESRTIGAFLTAGMLPRLQTLRDRRWVIFLLATNIERLEELDEAVRRPGRFDYEQKVSHPRVRAQESYVRRRRREGEISAAQVASLIKALRRFNRERPVADDEEGVPFAVLDYAISEIVERNLSGTERMLSLLVKRMKHVKNPPRLSG